MKGEDLTVLEKNYSVNSQAFVLEAALTISLKKISMVLFKHIRGSSTLRSYILVSLLNN